ncbi:hypothetical protein MRX96_004840 [Rhipicephalus microplus]
MLTPFDAQPRRSTRVSVASELCRRLVVARTCNGSHSPQQILGDRAAAMQSASDVLCPQPPQVQDYHQGAGRPSCPRRYAGHASSPEAPPETAGGLKPAAPGLGLPHDELLLREHQRVKIGFRRWLPRRGLGFSAPVEGLARLGRRESNKMANRQPGDDYDELDKI